LIYKEKIRLFDFSATRVAHCYVILRDRTETPGRHEILPNVMWGVMASWRAEVVSGRVEVARGLARVWVASRPGKWRMRF